MSNQSCLELSAYHIGYIFSRPKSFATTLNVVVHHGPELHANSWDCCQGHSESSRPTDILLRSRSPGWFKPLHDLGFNNLRVPFAVSLLCGAMQ